ncbi:MAG: helix-turn-helix transcriptional regulator [Ramlibacter sp.]|nr:helix-turn-helix transcriptional regulator [Ramlibacter sp.]
MTNLPPQEQAFGHAPFPPFTPQEERIAEYVETGMSSLEIAERLNCEASTVEKHRANMVKKIGVSGPGGLLKWLRRRRRSQLALPQAEKSALTGYWLSRFSFESLDRNSRPDAPRFVNSAQINIEELKPEQGYFSHAGRNVCGTRKTQGTVYMHQLRFQVKHRTAVGIWDNGDNTDNVGCFQMFIYSDCRMMAGHHLGNASNGAVKSGDWVWIKLSDSPGFEITPDRLRAFGELDSLVESFLNGAAAPAVADLFV